MPGGWVAAKYRGAYGIAIRVIILSTHIVLSLQYIIYVLNTL